MASRTSGKESAVCEITAAGAVGAAVALGAAVDAGAEVVPEELLLLEEASLAAGAAVRQSEAYLKAVLREILSGGIEPGYTILADLQLDFIDNNIVGG